MIRLLKLVLGSMVVGVLLIILCYKAIAVLNGLDSRLTTAYGVLPVLVIEDTKMILSGELLAEDATPQGGSMGPIIVIFPGSSTDNDILQHELAHVKQYYRYGLFLSVPLYFKSQKHRVKFEYEAYMAEENKLSPKEFIYYMQNYYDVDLTDKEIHNIIKNV